MADKNKDKVKEESFCVINDEENGITEINISDDVVKTIAALAAEDVEGIGGLCGSKANDIIERLGKKNSSRGVKVEVENNEAQISLSVLINYGYVIEDVCKEVQKAVKSTVETMTGLQVKAITIMVQGISPEENAEG